MFVFASPYWCSFAWGARKLAIAHSHALAQSPAPPPVAYLVSRSFFDRCFNAMAVVCVPQPPYEPCSRAGSIATHALNIVSLDHRPKTVLPLLMSPSTRVGAMWLGAVRAMCLTTTTAGFLVCTTSQVATPPPRPGPRRVQETPPQSWCCSIRVSTRARTPRTGCPSIGLAGPHGGVGIRGYGSRSRPPSTCGMGVRRLLLTSSVCPDPAPLADCMPQAREGGLRRDVWCGGAAADVAVFPRSSGPNARVRRCAGVHQLQCLCASGRGSGLARGSELTGLLAPRPRPGGAFRGVK